MAQAMIGNTPLAYIGQIVDKRRANGVAGTQLDTTSYAAGTLAGNFADIAKLKARLTAISGTTYTAAVLNAMTVNDMVYAIRVNDEAGSI